MPSIVLTFPILPGKVEAWRRFCQKLSGSRSAAFAGSRRRLGIVRERMALLEMASASAAATILEAPDLGRMLSELVASNLPFDVWYRRQIEDLHGVSLARHQAFNQSDDLVLALELLFEWSATPPFGTAPNGHEKSVGDLSPVSSTTHHPRFFPQFR